MFARACQLPGKNKEKGLTAGSASVQELLTEVQSMKAMLVSKMASIYQNTSEEPSHSSPSIWSSPDDQDAVATALSPKLMKAQGGVTELLYEVVTLEVQSRLECHPPHDSLVQAQAGHLGSFRLSTLADR